MKIELKFCLIHIKAILSRKNGKKWGNIEKKIGSNFGPRLDCSRSLHYTLLMEITLMLISFESYVLSKQNLVRY